MRDITAKDFRTWAGTVLAYRALRALAPGDTDDGASRRNVVEAVRLTSDRLGNTPAVARRSYVHPAILEAYLDGSIGGALLEAAEEQSEPPSSPDPVEERRSSRSSESGCARSGRKATERPAHGRRARTSRAVTDHGPDPRTKIRSEALHVHELWLR